MKKYKIYLGALLMMVFTTFTSCDEVGDIEIDGTTVEEMAGNWYVEVSNAGTNYGFFEISTYNSAANIEEIWIDDLGNVWPFKGKVAVNLSSMTFSGTDIQSEYDEVTFTVQNGVIVKDVEEATSGGNTSDTISFDVIFSDGGPNPWEFRGYKRTGFPEDEH